MNTLEWQSSLGCRRMLGGSERNRTAFQARAAQALTGQARLQKTLQKGTVLQNAGKGRERCFCLFVRLFLPVEGLGRLREGHEALDWVLKTR